MKKENLIFKIVTPFLLSLIFAVVFTLSTLYYLQKKHINQQSAEKLENISAVMHKTVNNNIDLFKEFIEFLEKDEKVVKYYKERNRDALFLYLHQKYLDLNKNHNITHLYIHGTDKTNFLRVHNKDMHSDKIERITLDKAVETGAAASGIEFGMNHNFVLRVVLPWYDNGELIGYIEIGKNIEYISKDLSDILNTNIIFTINKGMINEKEYKEWINSSNSHRYRRLKNSFVINSTMPNIRPSRELLNILDKKEDITNFVIQDQGHVYSISSESLYDISHKNIGKMHVLVDISYDITELAYTIFKVVSLLLIIMIVILFYYYRYIKKIDNILEEDKKTIEFNFKFERYVNKISNELFINDDIDMSINNTLKNLGEILDAHRAYLFLFKDNYDLMDNTHEWCAKGVNHEMQNLRNESTKPFKWWLRQCRSLKPIVIEDIEDLPDEAHNEKLSLIDQHIRSLLVYQIVSKGSLIGFVGIDMVNENTKWTPTHHSFVKITAEAISVAFDKKADSERIINAYDDISLTLNSASNGILVINEKGKITLYNKNFINMWDLNEESVRLNTHTDLLKKLSDNILNYEQISKYVESLIENNHAELTFITYLKDSKIFEVTSLPRIKDHIFKGRIFTFRDVTDEINAQKEIELAAKVFENSLEGIIITDADANIMKVNNSFLKITGFSKDEILGHKPSILHSDWQDEVFYKRLWNDLLRNEIWEGEIKDRRKNGEMYISYSTIILIKDKEDNKTNYIGFTRDITKIKEDEEHIKTLAYYDSLTNLPNRSLFMDRLGQSLLYCKRNDQKSALLFIDLDNFKYVNDTYGHHTGDLLLQKVAEILSQSVRESDTVSRLSGDEFTIILRNIESKGDILTIANKIIEKLSKPIMIKDDLELNIGSSIGAAVYPDDAKDEESLIKMADSAMYSAKENGKNRLKFYNE